MCQCSKNSERQQQCNDRKREREKIDKKMKSKAAD